MLASLCNLVFETGDVWAYNLDQPGGGSAGHEGLPRLTYGSASLGITNHHSSRIRGSIATSLDKPKQGGKTAMRARIPARHAPSRRGDVEPGNTRCPFGQRC